MLYSNFTQRFPMKKHLIITLFLGFISFSFGQIKQTPGQVSGSPINVHITSKNIQKRGVTNPSSCQTDTASFTDLSSTGYPLIALGNGQLVGQFFAAPQEITINGFRFFAYTPWDTIAKNTSRNVYAKIYKAGPDSLPRGAALDSVLVKIDTVTGTLTFNRLVNDAVFNKPITLDFDYILTVECTEVTNIPSIVCNSWSNGDGENRNLSVINFNNRWYRGRSLSVGGVTFDAHFQIFPFVNYKFGTDFTVQDDCYLLLDTFTFENHYLNTVAGSVFYNNYMYYSSAGFDALCHTWIFDNKTILKEVIDGKFKPGSKKNIPVKLNSFVVPFSLSLQNCVDSTEKLVYYKPNTPGFTGSADGCMGSDLTLTLNPNSDLTNRWYYKETDTSSFNTGATYTLSNLSADDTFFIKATNGPCISRTYTAYITANKTPSTLTVTNDSICSDASAILKASSDEGNIIWYKSATGGTPVLTGSELITGKLTADTTYFAEANNKGCLLSTGRKAVTAFVNADFAPPKPTGVSDTNVCYSGGTQDLTLRAFTTSSANIRWFDVTAGGTPLSQSNNLVYNITGRGSKSFYVETWDGRCGSGRVPVTVLVGATPNTFAKVSDEICLGDSANIAASASWGDVLWYAAKTSTQHYATGKFIRVGGLTQAKSFVFFKTADGKCINTNFDSVEVTVNIPPTASIVKADDVCNGAKASIELNVTQGTILWYFDNAASNTIATGKTLNLGQIYSNTTRYYETELNGCKSKRNAITIKALDKPAAGFQFLVEFPKKLICTPLNTNNMTVFWDFGDGNTSTDDIGINTYDNEAQYTVKMLATSTLSGCQDSVSQKITINHNNTETPHINFQIHPNPAQAGSDLFTMVPVEKAIWMDLSGRIVSTEMITPTATNTLDLWKTKIAVPAHFQNGIYLLQLEYKGQTETIKIQIN